MIITSHLPAGDIQAALQGIGQDAGPDDVGEPVAAALKVGEQAVDDVRLGREQIDGVHVGVHLPPLLDALDIWLLFSAERCLSGGRPGGPYWRCGD